MQGKIGQGQVIKWRERNVFRWTPEFVSVELSYVKKIPKNKGSFEKFWKWQLNVKEMENLKKVIKNTHGKVMEFEELKGLRTLFFLAVLNSVVMEWAT